MKRALLLALAILTMGVSVVAAQPKAVALEATKDVCAGIGSASGKGGCESTGPSLTKIIRIVINVFSSIVGVVAVIMLIVGGFRYVTSGGDSGNLSSAKNTIIYAVVGLIIVGLAQFIVQFVLQKIK